jgi:hypothetical protein
MEIVKMRSIAKDIIILDSQITKEHPKMLTFEKIATKYKTIEEKLAKLEEQKAAIVKDKEDNHDKYSREEIMDISDQLHELNDKISDLKKDLNIYDLDINRKAFDIMEKGDPADYIIKVYNKMHLGDTSIGKVLLLAIANTCILNTEGLQPKLSGGSGKGKTHAVNAIFHLIPDMPYKLEGSLSAKSLFYNPDLVDGMIIFSDDIEMNPDLENTLKRSMGSFQKSTYHSTLDKDRNYKKMKLPKRITWWLTAVNTDYSDELINRLFDLSVDDSPDMDTKVAERIFENAAKGIEALPENEEVKICRAIIHITKSQEFKVKIPFGGSIEWHVPGDRRNPSRFVSLIMGFAVLRYLQRAEMIEDGAILADMQDYLDAKAIYEKGKANQISKLTDTELKFVKWMVDQGKALSINEILDGYLKPDGNKYTFQGIRKLLIGEEKKNKKGLADKVPMKIIKTEKGTKYHIEKFEEFKDAAVTLKGERSNEELMDMEEETM